MSQMIRIYGIVLLAVAFLALTPAASDAANCCSVNGGSCNIIPPLTHGQSGWMGAVCGTTLSGINCTAKLDADVSTSSPNDCITLGSGVTFDLDGYTMNCTAGSTSACGTAITNTASSSASGAVTIRNGDIVGRWATGILATGGTNSSVDDVVIDGATSMGISGVRGLIERTVVRNVLGSGVELQPGKDIKTQSCGKMAIRSPIRPG